jgi:putative Mg2+ transporter-C (MgtC) family protein
MPISEIDMLIRLGVAMLLGGAIGYERELRERPAGLRTHLLVVLASAAFALVSFHAVPFQHYVNHGIQSYDVGRIASNIVVGIGFLGGGAIVHSGLTVEGLTTAASLWLSAAIGLAAGAGMFLLASAATVLTLFSLVVLWALVEVPRRKILRLTVRIVLEGEFIGRAQLVAFLEPLGLQVTGVDYRRDLSRNSSRMDLRIRLPSEDLEERLMKRLEELPGLRLVKVTRQ